MTTQCFIIGLFLYGNYTADERLDPLMTISSNYSDIRFGIENNAERYSWAAYHLFGVLSTLIGDTLILFASLQKDAFKVNKFILTVIQHIAASDLISAICTPFSGSVSLLANSWVLGETLCYARVYVGNYAYLVGMSLIAVLTTSKFLLLRYPLRAASWSTKRAHQVCSFIWASILILPILLFIVDKDDVEFDYIIYNCQYRYSSDIWNKILPFTGFLFALLPNIIIVGTTVPTLKYLADARISARRVQGSVLWQGNLTVVLTAVIYCISTFPYSIYTIIVESFMTEDPPEWFHVKFNRMSYFLMILNIMSNFYVYTITIKSFRRFLLSRLFSVVPHTVSISA